MADEKPQARHCPDCPDYMSKQGEKVPCPGIAAPKGEPVAMICANLEDCGPDWLLDRTEDKKCYVCNGPIVPVYLHAPPEAEGEKDDPRIEGIKVQLQRDIELRGVCDMNDAIGDQHGIIHCKCGHKWEHNCPEPTEREQREAIKKGREMNLLKGEPMKQMPYRWLLASLFVLSWTIGVLVGDEPRHPGRFIVKHPSPSLGMDIIKPLGHGRFLVEVPAEMDVDAAIVAALGSVDYAEPDYLYFTSLIPNDTLYHDVEFPPYWFNIMQAEAAWDISIGSPSVEIGIIDTGADLTSPDIISKVVHNYNYWNPGLFPTGHDDGGHGSHVAGIAAAVANNNHGYPGTCWDCSIGIYKGLGCTGGGFASDLSLAIDQAVADGVPITNSSWGGNSFSQTLYDSISAACDAGVLMVFAAGNNSRNTDAVPYFPASMDLPCILSVGASDPNDELTSFSNWGSVTVDLLAPGDNIGSLNSPVDGSQCLKPRSPFSVGQLSDGTSMAAPFVAGTAGLMLALQPSWDWVELIPAILDNVDTIPAASNTVSGGRLNMLRAVEAAEGSTSAGGGSGGGGLEPPIYTGG